MQRYLPALKALAMLSLLCGSLAILGISATYLYLNPKLPSVEKLRDAKMQIPLRIYSQNGELIGEYGEKFRTPIRMEDVPESFIQAILAAEDDRFLEHKGIDLAGLIRAALELLKSGEIKTGGSTITMQVARNFFLSKERSFVRKFNEILLSLKIERLFTKGEILELYVNKIYLGKRAYGIQAAAAIYYGKTVDQLNLAQLAMIAGLPKAPSSFNPINNPARAIVRRDWILGRMHKLGFIDDQQLQQTTSEPVSASYHGPKLQLEASYAAEMARAFVVEQFGLPAYTQGLRVVTTVDAKQQRAAKQSVTTGLDNYSQRHGYRHSGYRIEALSLEDQLKALGAIKKVNDLLPALVTDFISIPSPQQRQTNEKTDSIDSDAPPTEIVTLQLLLQDGSIQLLDWNHNADSVRLFINENRRSKRIHDIRQVADIGDVIYVRVNEENQLRLALLPQAAASLIALDPYDGAIKAVVGGYDFGQSHFNRASQAFRQPGSNFKPFIYAAALSNGYTAASVINDAPIVFADEKLETDWRPENASGKFYGPTTLRRALYLSRNLVSVRLLRQLGITNAVNYLENFDLGAGRLPKDLSLALGSYAMTPLNVASMYATIANGGYKISPHIVSAIYNRNHQLLYKANPPLACDRCKDEASEERQAGSSPEIEFDIAEAESLDELFAAETDYASHSAAQTPTQPPTQTQTPDYPPVYAERIMDERIAYILDNILKDVIQRGTGTKARELGRKDIAGKTGTTNGPTDAWFSGYHPRLVATAWLGFDDNQLLGKREYGGSAALPIWMQFMNVALQDLPVIDRDQPQGLRSVKIDRITGLKPTAQTEEILFETFRAELAPVFNDNNQNAGGFATNKALNETISEDLF